MDFLCTFLQYSSLRGPRTSTTISSCFHLEGAPKGTKGLKNGSCGQWLTAVQSTRRKRRGNGDPAQAVTAERGCRVTGRGVWGWSQRSSRRAAGFASVGRHATHMQLRRNPRTSPRTQLCRRVYLTTTRGRKTASGTD